MLPHCNVYRLANATVIHVAHNKTQEANDQFNIDFQLLDKWLKLKKNYNKMRSMLISNRNLQLAQGLAKTTSTVRNQ